MPEPSKTSSLRPYFGGFCNCSGVQLLGLSQLRIAAQGDAVRHYEEAIEIRPDFAAAYSNLGTVYQKTSQKHLAERAFRKAIEHNPQQAEAYTNLCSLLESKRPGSGRVDGTELCEKAVRMMPDLAAAHYNLGRVYELADRWQPALESYEKALKLSGAYDEAFVSLYHVRQQVCEWSHVRTDLPRLVGIIASFLRGETTVAVNPFRAFAYPLPPDLFLKLNQQVVGNAEREMRGAASAKMGKHATVLLPAAPEGKPRLRVAYASSDFGAHTVGSLIRHMFEYHDRNLVDVVALSLGADDGSPWRLEMQAAADEFVDGTTLSEDALVSVVGNAEVHILVDLNGHSKGGRLGLWVRKPAPITINWLGYPSSSGGLTMYALVDKTTAPPELSVLYTEKLVWLPHSYFISDHRNLYPRRVIAVGEEKPTRESLGLPERGTVLCNFGQLYKVDARVFALWVRLLTAVDGAVLWLLSFPPDATDRLLKEARRRGVDESRIVFSKLFALDKHIEIKALCDVGLDTLTFNGHTTFADPLYAGVPIVSSPSERMASRVGASLLLASGLPELVARTDEEYVALAKRLATAPLTARAKLRARVASRVDAQPLFDTRGFVRGWERAQALLWDVHVATRRTFHVVVASAD